MKAPLEQNIVEQKQKKTLTVSRHFDFVKKSQERRKKNTPNNMNSNQFCYSVAFFPAKLCCCQHYLVCTVCLCVCSHFCLQSLQAQSTRINTNRNVSVVLRCRSAANTAATTTITKYREDEAAAAAREKSFNFHSDAVCPSRSRR